jgi:hypothetical protein
MITVLCSLLVTLALQNEAFSQTQPDTLWGPVTLIREAGKPQKGSYTFNQLQGFQGPYYIVVQNGGPGEKKRISSASIMLNGLSIASQNIFNQNVPTLRIPVALLDVNTLEVTIASAPGAFLRISVEGQRELSAERVLAEVSGVVEPGGGSVSLAGFASVTLPPDANRLSSTIKIQKMDAVQKLALYEEETMGEHGPAWRELIRIISSENLSKPVAVAVSLPQQFLSTLPANHRVELFAEFTQYGADNEVMSSFQRLGTTIDPASGIAFASIPPYAFEPIASVATTIVIGSYPCAGCTGPTPIAPSTTITLIAGSPQGSLTVEPAQVIPLHALMSFSVPAQLSSPLDRNLVATSNFGQRTLTLNGITTTKFHFGIDYAADTSNLVYPAASGQVEAHVNNNACGRGVIIRHSDGSSTKYCHMLPSHVPPPLGQSVGPTNTIGTADTTGGVTGPHLHLQYHDRDGAPIDPHIFMNQQDVSEYLGDLSVVAVVNGRVIEETRAQVNAAVFSYSASLNVATLRLATDGPNVLAVAVENPLGTQIILFRTSLLQPACTDPSPNIRVFSLGGPTEEKPVASYNFTPLGGGSMFASGSKGNVVVSASIAANSGASARVVASYRDTFIVTSPGKEGQQGQALMNFSGSITPAISCDAAEVGGGTGTRTLSSVSAIYPFPGADGLIPAGNYSISNMCPGPTTISTEGSPTSTHSLSFTYGVSRYFDVSLDAAAYAHPVIVGTPSSALATASVGYSVTANDPDAKVTWCRTAP